MYFTIDEPNKSVLVSAMEDLEGVYRWGCQGVLIDGADGESLGSGYQNTLDIVSGCSETDNAASAALNFEANGYSDWYLPSSEELQLLHNNIGFVAGNSAGVTVGFYWTSTEDNNGIADVVYNGNNGITPSIDYKNFEYFVRVIRTASYGGCIAVVNGCMEETAFNYNEDANTDDGSCVEVLEDVQMLLHLTIMLRPILMMDRVLKL